MAIVELALVVNITRKTLLSFFGLFVILTSSIAFLSLAHTQALSLNTRSITHTFADDHCAKENLDAGNCGIIKYLVIFINTLAALVGVIVIIMIIIGGIQYSSAGDDPQKIQAAKSKITNALLALLAFIFMFSFLQWIVPGGIF